MEQYEICEERGEYINRRLVEMGKRKLYDTFVREPDEVLRGKPAVAFDAYAKAAFRDYYDLPEWLSFEEFKLVLEDELKADYAEYLAGVRNEEDKQLVEENCGNGDD